MDFWKRLREYCVEETDRDTLPESVCISCEERDGFSEFDLSGTWTVEKKHSDVFGSILVDEEEDDELINWPENEQLTIEEGSLFEETCRVFFNYLEKVQIQDADLRGVTLFGPNHSTGFIDGASARLFVDSTSELDGTVNALRSEIADELKNLDKTVQTQDVIKISSALSDRDVCQAETVDAKILTQRPAGYLKDVEHVKEAASIVADTDDEEEDIVDAEGYVGMFIGKSTIEDYEMSEELPQIVEEDVRNVFQSTVKTDLDTSLEGEVWSVNAQEVPDDYYSFASGIADCENVDVGEKSVAFWVHTPLRCSDSV